MTKELKEIVLIIAVLSLVGLSLSSCAKSNATQSAQRDNSVSTSASIPAPVSGMSHMNVPAATKASAAMQPDAPNQVLIGNFSFAPATLTVKAGTKVTWINRDDVPHTVDEVERVFKSGTLDTDDQYSYTFNTAGTFKYFCALHPKMVGQIIVK